MRCPLVALELHLARTISGARRARGLSQESLARLAGVSRRTVSRLEGRRHSDGSGSLRSALAVSSALGLSLADVLLGAGDFAALDVDRDQLELGLRDLIARLRVGHRHPHTPT